MGFWIFMLIMDVLRSFVEDGSGVDMLLANYVYEKPRSEEHTSELQSPC